MIEKIVPILYILFFLFISIFNFIIYIKLKKVSIKVSKEEEEAGKYYLRKSYNEAIKRYEKVLLEDKNNSRVLFLLGISYYLIGRYEKAIEKLNKKILLGADDIYNMADSYILLIKSYIEINDLSSAKQLFIKYKYYYDKVLQEPLKLIRINEENISLETKGWLKFKEGKFDEVMKIYEKIIPAWKKYFKTIGRKEQYLHQYSDLFYHFGIISKHKGEYDKAIKYFKKSIKAGGPESIFSKRSEEEIRKIVNGEL